MWLDKYHVIRRLLIFAITYVFLKVTINLFNGSLDAFKVSAYGILTGLETLIVKFYLDSRDKEDKL